MKGPKNDKGVGPPIPEASLKPAGSASSLDSPKKPNSKSKPHGSVGNLNKDEPRGSVDSQRQYHRPSTGVKPAASNSSLNKNTLAPPGMKTAQSTSSLQRQLLHLSFLNAADGKKAHDGPPGEHERRESLRRQVGGVFVKRMSRTGTNDQPFARQGSKLSSSASIHTRLTNVSRHEYHVDLKPHIKSGITINLAFATFVIALGSSYQFGYNIGVLNNPAVLIKDFYNATYTERNGYIREHTLIMLWSLTTAFFIPGGMAGAFIGGAIADRIGRKKGILISHILIITGGIIGTLCVWAKAPEMLMVARILFGIHAGITNCLAPMFLTEISPFNLRGALGTVHQLAITIGIFMSSVFGHSSLLGTKSRWPYLMLMECLPAVLSLLILPFLPESPRYLLLLRKERKLAEKALQYYRQTHEVTCDMEEMDTESQDDMKARDPKMKEGEAFTLKRLFLDRNLRLPLFIACFLQIIQQFSGINAIFFFSTTIFQASGVPDSQIPYAVIGTNAVNVAITIISVPLMDKAGRRFLLLVPMVIMVVNLILLTISQVLQDKVPALSYVSVACVITYVICFAIGLGPIPMMIGAELFRQGPRPLAMATAGSVNWICTFCIAISFESIQSATKQYTFVIFLVLMVIFTGFVFIKVPETKNKTFEQIAHEFAPGDELEVQEIMDNVFDDLPNDFGDAEDNQMVTINFGGKKSITSTDDQSPPNNVNSDGVKRKSTDI